MSRFAPVSADAPHVATCPSCGEWLWKIKPDSGFFGAAPIEKAMRYLASDGDTVIFPGGAMPPPLSSNTEWDAQVLMGACPHCGGGYWFITVAYPERAIDNGNGSFVCDEGYIDILDQVDGALVGDATVCERWVLLRQRAQWQEAAIRLDVHMVGPFSDGDRLVGEHGVSGCGGGGDAADIWALAREVVRAITPSAVAYLRAGVAS